MDPDATLRELRVLSARVITDHRLAQADVDRMGELVSVLDTWLASGGFLPSAWHLSACMSHDCRAAEVDHLTRPGVNADGTLRCHPGDCDGSGVSTEHPDGGCHCHVCS